MGGMSARSAAPAGRTSRQEKFLIGIGVVLFAAAVAVAFRGYFTPAMLVDFVLRLCS